jgi:hypothetical protein
MSNEYFRIIAAFVVFMPWPVDENIASKACAKTNGIETREYRVCMANELWLKEQKP